MEVQEQDKLASERKGLCVKGHLCIDTIEGTVKGYTKAHVLQKRPTRANSKVNLEKTIIHPQKVATPSEAFNSILKKCGVDKIGY